MGGLLNWVIVFAGGGVGSLVRYAIAQLLSVLQWDFPLATFLANVLSCIIYGIVAGFSMKGEMQHSTKLLLTTGFCGGFSTFSAFSNETYLLYQSGQYFQALLNVVGSVVVCLSAIHFGYKLVS